MNRNQQLYGVVGSLDVHKIVITPAGTAVQAEPGRQWARWLELARRIWLLVLWNLRKRVFDKSTGALFLVVEPMMQALLFFYIVYLVFGVRGDDVSYVSIFTLVTLWRGHAMITSNAPYYLSGQAAILQQTRYSPAALVAEGIATDAALFLMLVVVVIAVLLIGGHWPQTCWIALPLVLAVNLLFSAACAVLIACGGVFVRELGVATNFVVSLWMYASPVVYGMERIHEPFRTVYRWINPLAHIMPAYRSVLLDNEWPAFGPLVAIALISILLLVPGGYWLSRLRGRIYRYL